LIIEFSYGASTIELDDSDRSTDTLPLQIKGMSVRHGYIKSNHVIIPNKELSNIARTLKHGIDGTGAYILKDHGYKTGIMGIKSIDNLIGKISNAFVRDESEVRYTGRIEDEDISTKIRKNLVSSSSVGLKVERIYCSICGLDYGDPECNHRIGREYPDECLHESVAEYLDDMNGVPKAALVGEDITAKEQSIVLFPAVEGATMKQFNFSEESQKLIEEVEASKIDPELDETKIIQALEGIVLEDVMAHNEALKTYAEEMYEDNLKLRKMLYCEVNDLEYEKLKDLSLNEIKKVNELVESQINYKGSAQGFVAQNEQDILNTRKEDFRELIFGVRRDGRPLKKKLGG